MFFSTTLLQSSLLQVANAALRYDLERIGAEGEARNQEPEQRGDMGSQTKHLYGEVPYFTGSNFYSIVGGSSILLVLVLSHRLCLIQVAERTRPPASNASPRKLPRHRSLRAVFFFVC